MPSDDNTERELIGLLTRVLGDFFKDERHAMVGFAARLTLLEQNSDIRHQQLMTAIETLTASADALTKSDTDLTGAVNDAITRIGTPGVTDAQILGIASVIDHNTAVITAQTVALRAALDAPPPPVV
jgi:hypothetical protein